MDKFKGKGEGNVAEDSHRDYWLAFLNDYVDGTLPEAEIVRLEGHLAGCAACTADLEGLRQATGLLRRLPEVAVPCSFALNSFQVRRLKPSPFYRASQVAAAIAAVFLLAVVLFDLAGSAKTATPPDQVAVVSTSAPTPTPPLIGTLPPSDTVKGGGPVVGQAGLTPTPPTAVAPNPTVAPVISAQPKASSVEGPSALRLAEIGLVLALVLFAVFAFALRPRAPGRLRGIN